MINSISKYKTYLPDYLEKYHNIKPKKFFNCINPNHIDKNPSMMFTDKYNICKCFACGVSYDIFDIIGIDYNLKNFKEKILKLEELYSVVSPTIDLEKKENNIIYDYSNYYTKCLINISKNNYLQNRGIKEELLFKYSIGYDEEKNLIIFPINKNCYFARSTINNNKLKSKGKSDIWNKSLLNNSDEKTIIYVTEGIIDSLSLETIDSNIKTISINGVGNINKLIETIKNVNYKGIIIISFDNDNAGIQASKLLKEELTKINVNSFSNTLISNFDPNICNDLNSALLTNKEKLKNNYEYANTAYMRYTEQLIKEEGNIFEY